MPEGKDRAKRTKPRTHARGRRGAPDKPGKVVKGGSGKPTKTTRTVKESAGAKKNKARNADSNKVTARSTSRSVRKKEERKKSTVETSKDTNSNTENTGADFSQHWTLRSQSDWHGIFIGCELVRANQLFTVGLMFSNCDFATQVFDEIRSWINGNSVDVNGRIQASVIRTEEEIHYFVYPLGKRPPYPVLSYAHAAVEGVLPAEFPPTPDADFLLQPFVVRDGGLQPISSIRPIKARGLKYALYSDLTSEDLERYLLRFDASSILASEPYRLPLPHKATRYARLNALQREYFVIVDEFFDRMVGRPASKVNSADEAVDLTWKRLNNASFPIRDPYAWVRDRLLSFHVTFRDELAQMPKEVGGVKLLLGGGRFSEAYSTAIQRTILYADTIMVPDPLLPWFEGDRNEERFQVIPFLQAAYHLLRYRPLVDADLPYPALLVFPTWERTELRPQGTVRNELDRFFVQVVSHYLGVNFDAKEELSEFVTRRQADFLKAVEEHHLFVPPQASPGMPLRASVPHYRRWLEQWRAGDSLKWARQASDAALVLAGIYERLSPQFMMMRASDALVAQPLLSVSSQWHYYSLVTRVFSETLASEGLLSPATVALLRALETDKFRWLGNVPMSALVRLRVDDETKQFRERLNEFVNELHSSRLDDLDQVASEVSRGIASLLGEHQKRLASIERKYQRTHILTLGASIVTLAAAFIPALAPFVGLTAPGALVLKYARDKLEERNERKEISRSLMGVLTSAADS